MSSATQGMTLSFTTSHLSEPERGADQPNGQWLKSIKFKLPIIEEDMNMSLDNNMQAETVCLLSRVK